MIFSGRNLFGNGSTVFLFSNFQVVRDLEVHPKAFSSTQITSDSQGKFPIYVTFALNDFPDGSIPQTQRFIEFIGRDIQLYQFIRKEFARVYGSHSNFGGIIRASIVVIDYFNVVRRAIHPPKADSPLTIDPDTVLSLTTP